MNNPQNRIVHVTIQVCECYPIPVTFLASSYSALMRTSSVAIYEQCVPFARSERGFWNPLDPLPKHYTTEFQRLKEQ